MVLTLLLLVPLLAGLLCLAIPGRVWWERLNLMAFVIVAGLALVLGLDIAHQSMSARLGRVTALAGFLQADALSALVVVLIAFVALVWSIYVVGYFRRDLAEGRITATQLLDYYVLTPL